MVLPLVVGGDPFLWVLVILLGALVLSARKLIQTLGQIARVELWVWCSKRHQKAPKNIRSFIDKTSCDDLKPRRSFWRNLWWRPPKDPK